jgi:hypothetical protein
VPFGTVWAAAQACPAAEDAFPGAVRSLFEAFVLPAEFKGLLSGGAAK